MHPKISKIVNFLFQTNVTVVFVVYVLKNLSNLDQTTVKRLLKPDYFNFMNKVHCGDCNNASLLCVGATSVDIVATVSSFPFPDEKIRTKSLFFAGGGNAGNTSVATSKLGIYTRLFSKIGNDSNGVNVLKDFFREGVNTNFLNICHLTNTSLVIVIVDEESKTRTCIATPVKEELTSSQVQKAIKDGILDGVCWLHLDSRHTEAALTLAREAVQRGIPISIDVEKDRPFLMDLLPLCDVVFASESFSIPTRCGGVDMLSEPSDLLHNSPPAADPATAVPPALLPPARSLSRLFSASRTRVAVCTLGDKGALLLRRADQPEEPFPSTHCAKRAGAEELAVAELSAVGMPVHRSQYACPLGDRFEALYCPALQLPAERVRDSTGAGDAFIGGFLAALLQLTATPLDDCLRLGTLVAAECVQQAGARTGLPDSAAANALIRSRRTDH